MPISINERFNVQTLIRDVVAGQQSLSESVLITNNDLFSGASYRRVSINDYATLVSSSTYPEEFKWLETYFSQELKPTYAGILFWDNTADPAEDLSDALQALIDLSAEFYVLHYVGVTASDSDEQLAIGQAVEALGERAQFICMTQDSNAVVSGNQTHIGYLASSNTLNRTTVIYHPATITTIVDGAISTVDASDERPDAAIWGRMAITAPGAAQFDFKTLVGITDANLSAADRTVLEENGYNWVEQLKRSAAPYLYPGRTCTGREIRVQWGADWFDINVQSSLANLALRTDLMSFDDDTFTAVEGIIRNWGEQAIDRRIILDDLVVDLPDPDTVGATTRASGIASFTNVYSATLNSAIDGWTITGDWTIGGV